jgi:hypothetical protein
MRTSSSISGSEASGLLGDGRPARLRGETLRVFLLAVAFLASVEVLLRVGAPRFSQDLRHIGEIDRRIENLSRQPHPRILFLGNSLTRNGIDSTVFTQALFDSAGVAASVALLYPDDTTIADWYYLLRSRLRSPSLWPDVLVVPFANRHLTDQSSIDPARLGAWMAGMSQAPEVFRYDLRSFGDRVTFVLSAAFRLVSDAERFRNQVLALAVPGYRTAAQRFNEVEIKHRRKGRPADYTYGRLERFLVLSETSGTRVVFVAVPQPQLNPFPNGLPGAIGRAGSRVQLEDFRHLDGLSRESFLDGYHLSEGGARLFSDVLGRAASRWLEGARGPAKTEPFSVSSAR